jgi:hypothetical protein
LHSDRTRKAGDKIIHYAHYDERQRIIEAIGYDKWERTGQAEIFGDIAPPVCFADLFSVFIDIYYLCPNGITYQDIAAYRASTQNQLSVYEVSLIRKMASWAAQEANKAWREDR